MSDRYPVGARIFKGALCVLDDGKMRPRRTSDSPLLTEGMLLAAEGMHPGDQCYLEGDRVRKVQP